MAKESQKIVDSEDVDELEAVVAEAKKTSGRTPREIAVITREFSKMLEAVRMSKIDELAIGTYFVPYEGQIGIEGLVNMAAELMNRYVRAGWQPWQMATPYPSKTAFNLGGVETGALDGQWITIIWGKPIPEPEYS